MTDKKWMASAKGIADTTLPLGDTPYAAACAFVAKHRRKRFKVVNLLEVTPIAGACAPAVEFAWNARKIHVDRDALATLPGAPQ